MRNLATIQVINSVNPILNADAIEVVNVLGWYCVVKKSDGFQVGDRVVYCEVDSIMPDKPEFEFLKNSKGVMQRLRTIKLRGQVSMGLVLPLSVLPEGEYKEGQDVTEILGVTKWEQEQTHSSLRGNQKTSIKICFPDWFPQSFRKYAVKYFLPLCRLFFNRKMGSTFPPWIPKTDETRVQVLKPLLEKYEGTMCYLSEKLDGSSITLYWKDGEFGVCSRNIDLKEEEGNAFWDTVRDRNLKSKLKDAIKFFNMNNVALQGELIGEGIQKNKYGIKGKDIYFFNVFDIDKQRYLGFKQFDGFINHMEEKTVPILQTDHVLISDSDYYVELAKGKSVLKDVLREGIVIRPLEDTVDYDARGLVAGRVSFKAVSPDFLLKYDDN